MAESDNVIREGKAKIFLNENIFYNPVQEFNRDMSVAALTVFSEDFKTQTPVKPQKRRYNGSQEEPNENEPKREGITVVEALAATGLRSVRYALEVPNIAKIHANDCSKRAVETMNRNIKENGVEHIVSAANHDAVWLLQKLSFENQTVHAVDLDPYGCPTRFLDSAVNCIADGGLLMVTCTDMAVLAGNNPESCYVKYGSIALRSSACHEMALRIALQSIASLCGKYGRYIVPILSLSADFYIRIFVKIYSSPKMCKSIASNMSLIYQCVGCEMRTLQPLALGEEKSNANMKFIIPRGPPVSETCIHCGSQHRVGGPIWSGKLHDNEFVDKMIILAKQGNLATHKRMTGMLSLIREELNDVPLYYATDLLSSKLHCSTIPLVEMRSALLNAKYRVSSSHCNTNAIKTDAPQTMIWDIMREWVKRHPISEKRMKENNVISAILSKEVKFQVNFAYCKGAVPISSSAGLLRFQPNPSPNWGPGVRSKSKTFGDVSKKERNQNKKERNRIQKKRLKIEQPAICDPEKELNIEGNVNVNIDDDCKN